MGSRAFGAEIRIDFGNCAGSMSGHLLPSGSERDVLTIDQRSVHVSLVDAVTPFVFVRAADIGADGHESPSQLAGNADVMRRLECVRGWAAQVLKLVVKPDDATEETPNVGKPDQANPTPQAKQPDGGDGKK